MYTSYVKELEMSRNKSKIASGGCGGGCAGGGGGGGDRVSVKEVVMSKVGRWLLVTNQYYSKDYVYEMSENQSLEFLTSCNIKVAVIFRRCLEVWKLN